MKKKLVISFLTDNDVPDSVGDMLRTLGHDVVRVRDVMAADATDPVVAAAAIQASRILVSWDRDFNHQRFLTSRFERLCRIGMCCPKPEGAKRIKDLIDIVEFVVARAMGTPVTIVISASRFALRC